MKLIKHKEGYSLCIEENAFNSREFIATTDGMYVKHMLSKQNCDEIFGVVDVEKLVYEEYLKFDQETRIINRRQLQESLANMFNKAMELNEKTFKKLDEKLDSMVQAAQQLFKKEAIEVVEMFVENLKVNIQKIQQPTEIEVEIEMETCQVMVQHGDMEFQDFPKLDKNGCLILTKKK